jgi:hypothetical protein
MKGRALFFLIAPGSDSDFDLMGCRGQGLNKAPHQQLRQLAVMVLCTQATGWALPPFAPLNRGGSKLGLWRASLIRTMAYVVIG